MTAPKIYLGIDPGASGGLAAIWANGNPEFFPFKDAQGCSDAIVRVGTGYGVFAAIELVSGYIGRPQSGSHMFKFGHNAGIWDGIIAAYKIPHIHVRPQEWQLGIEGVKHVQGPARKRILKSAAQRRFPDFKVTLANCDALLLADWARRRNL